MTKSNNITKNFKGIIDSTLREGMQYRYSSFDIGQQKEIVRLLSGIGIDRIEVGNTVTKKVRESVSELVKIRNRPPLLSHVRNRLSDITSAIDTDVDGVNILCTVNSQRLKAMGRSFRQYLKILKTNILKAKEKQSEVRVSVENFFGENQNLAFTVFRLARDLGVDRIGIADTLGIAMSWELERIIGEIRKDLSLDIEVHFHNDLGQANSNAVNALKSGANWVDTTLLGIGERSGITALSTFLASLYIFNSEISKKYRLQNVTDAENILAGMIGKEVPFNLLTNRENGFAHKAGIHLHALVNFGPTTYEPVAPGVLGNVRQMVYGTGISGSTDKNTVENFYKKYGKS